MSRHFLVAASSMLVTFAVCIQAVCADTSSSDQLNQVFLREHNIPTVQDESVLPPAVQGNRNFVFQSCPHKTLGEAYVIVTDHKDAAHLSALKKLAEFHQGRIIEVDDLGALISNQANSEALRAQIIKSKPRYVAIAPRRENFRENVMLSLWSIFASCDKSGELAVYPGWLVAPDERSFDRLIANCLSGRQYARASLRPMIFAQVPGPRSGGTRAVAKAALLQKYFENGGCTTPALVLKTDGAVRAGLETPMFDAQKAVLPVGSAFLKEIPQNAQEQFLQSNLVLLFGHGITGMTCSIDVGAFEHLPFDHKIVLCGSCFSASSDFSDFKARPQNVDDSAQANLAKNSGEQFSGRAIANGAELFYGQMDTNGGFPELYVVLSNLLQGKSAGESYQALLNNRIIASGLAPDDFVLKDLHDTDGKERRMELLYVLIGDPALCPISNRH